MKEQNNEFLNLSYELTSAYEVLTSFGKDSMVKFNYTLQEMGYSREKLDTIAEFMNENMDEDGYEEFVELKCITKYIEGLQKMEQYMAMAQGYEEMGEINLEISEEMHHLEDEASNISSVKEDIKKIG